MKKSLAAVVVPLLLTACDAEVDIGPAEKAPGSITVLDTIGGRGQTGWWPSLAFDAHDQPHLSYCDAYHADLRYATRIGTQWHVSSVVSRGKVGKYTAIGVDSKGRAAIAFYDQDTKYLRYAWQTDDGWKDERLAWGLEVGMGGELRFDPNDVPHLFYYIPSGKLIHAYKPKGGDWQKQVVADKTGGFSVRIGPVLHDGVFWLSFVDWNFKDTALYLAHQTGDGFAVEKVTDRRGPGWRSQLVFEGNVPTVLYSQSFREDLRITTKTDGAWKSERLLRRASNFAAAEGPDGDLIVAYEDVSQGAAGNGTLKYLRRHGTSWSRFSVDPEGPAGAHLALALDSKGRPLIAYFSGVIRGLKVYDETISGQASVTRE